MVLLVGHSEAICHLPKHFMFRVSVLDDEVELCLVSTLEIADFPWGLHELPPSFLDMLVQLWLKVLDEFLLAALFLLSYCSTRTALCRKSSNSTYSCNSTTSLMSGFRPLKNESLCPQFPLKCWPSLVPSPSHCSTPPQSDFPRIAFGVSIAWFCYS